MIRPVSAQCRAVRCRTRAVQLLKHAVQLQALLATPPRVACQARHLGSLEGLHLVEQAPQNVLGLAPRLWDPRWGPHWFSQDTHVFPALLNLMAHERLSAHPIPSHPAATPASRFSASPHGGPMPPRLSACPTCVLAA